MRRLLLACAALIAAPTVAHAQTVAITGGKVVIGDGSAPIENGTVVFRDGRVVAAGRNVAVPSGARTIDAQGKWVTPGIVAGFSRLGLVGVDAVDQTNDAVARTSPFGAAIDVAPAINPDVPAMGVSRVAGVTRAIVAPETAQSMFAGQGAVIDTGADADAVTRPRAFQFIEFGEAGASEAGGSKAAAHVYFRNALSEVRDHIAGRNAAPSPHESLLKRPDMAALVPVLDGRKKLLVHVESATDILAILNLKREFNKLDLVIVGASEGWRVASQIAAANVPVIASALNDLPESFEQLGATQSNIGRMKAAGVKIAIGMINDNDSRQAQYSAQYAGNLVALTRVPGASGLSWDSAFAAITSKPAEIIGMGGEIGVLKSGARADVVIWDGDPLELSATATAIWIDGQPQSLANRQTRLRERYKTSTEGALPKAYDR
jgi:imidazolonepropionase-like amidohydrolase